MPFRLLSHDKCCPGEFRFEQPFAGRAKRFGPSPLIGEVAKAVADFRAGNRLPRASALEALEDIDAFTCARLGNSPRWCFNTEKSFDQLAGVAASTKCATCGAT